MRLLNRLVPVACFLVVLGFLVPINASKPSAAPQTITPHLDVLYAMPGDLNYSYGPKGADLAQLMAADRPATSSIVVTYNGFSPQAQTAFQAAVNIWQNILTSPAQIRVTANWTPLGTNILGSAGPSAGCQSSGPGAVANTYYATALADKLNGAQTCATAAGQTREINANFSSTFTDWEFGTSGTGVPGKYSFMTVVLHELGHGLGFVGTFISSGTTGNLLNSLPFIYDRFAVAGIGGSPLLNIARPSTALHNQLVSDNTFWSGTGAPNAKIETANFTTKYGVSSDSGWLQGSSYSHVDYNSYAGTANGLMAWALNSNTVYTDPGPVMRGIFTDSGWTVGGATVPRTPGDFTGDGHADFAVYRPSSGIWMVQGQANTQWGLAGDIPVPGDYNGDGKTEIAVYRPGPANWYLQQGGATVQWGRSGDIPVPGDYNGDGTTDIAVFRTSDSLYATWYIRNVTTAGFGLRGDIPVPADYDGDGKTDIAVFRPSSSVWYILNSSTGVMTSTAFGLPGDVPVPGKFDSDSRADLAVYRPSSGNWYLSMTAAGSQTLQFGLTGDIPVAQDISGDGVAELTVWRPATGAWFAYNRIAGTQSSLALGSVGDIPVMERTRLPSTPKADFDADGVADLTVYRVSGGFSYWYQRFSKTVFGTNAVVQWGLDIDIKVPGDYDGDHKTDVAVFRPTSGVWYIIQSASNTVRQIQFGVNGDVPMPGDYDGDGRTDLAVYRPNGGNWFVLRSSTDYTMYTVEQWGGFAGDVPKVGDFDGDGRADYAIFRPSNAVWYLKMSTTAFSVDRTLAKQFGLSTDTPVAEDFDGDGRTDLGVYRSSAGQWLGIDALTSYAPINQQLGVPTDIPDAHDFDGDGLVDAAVFRPSTGQWFFRPSSFGVVQVYQWGLNGDQPVVRTGGSHP